MASSKRSSTLDIWPYSVPPLALCAVCTNLALANAVGLIVFEWFLGTFGYLGTSLFVRKIYSTVKID